MAATAQEAAKYGITFSTGAAATPAGVANAKANGIVNNVQQAPSGGTVAPAMQNTGSGVATPVNAQGLPPEQVSNTPLDPNAINTTQPNPDTVNATPFTQPPVGSVPPATPIAAIQSNQKGSTTPQQLQAGLSAAQASGKAPQEAGAGRSGVAANLPPPSAPNPVSGAEGLLAQSPEYAKWLGDINQLNNIQAQSSSLLDFYNQAVSTAGIPAINTELINTKNIINGTEDDIRKEVQAAGGFATDSQVLALSGARNKQLIKNYNTLLDTKTMAMEQINNMTNLASQDRQFAMSAINQKLQIDQQALQIKSQMISASQEGYKNVIQAVGYSGLMTSLNGDPNSISLAEQTLGLGSGGLQSLASQQQNAQNLAAIQKEGITTPYYQSGQAIINSQTGQTYKSPEDFQAKTGMTLGQAGGKGLISSKGTTSQMTQLNLAEKIANINQSNASAAASRASANKSNLEASQLVSGGTNDKIQQKLEQEYRSILAKEVSSRSGTVGTEDAKVAQANHLSSLLNQYYDPKTGNYNVPKAQYGELVLGLAGMLSKTGTPTDSQTENINQRTAKGDINGAISYITGTPVNGSTQAVIKNLADSIQRQAQTAEQNREAGLKVLRGLKPTDLADDRAKALEANTLVPYTKIKGITDPQIKAMYTPDIVKQIRTLNNGRYQDYEIQEMVDNGYQPQQVMDLLKNK